MGCPTCQQETAHVHGYQTPCVDCSTPQCETPQPCTEITDAQCTIYTGANIKCGTDIVVAQNDNVAEAIAQITAYFCSKQGLITTADILCGSEVIIPTGTSVQDALALTVDFICGIQLTPGPQGTTGAQGIQGIQGMQGTQGLVGLQGVQGTTGRDGIQGIQGIVGSQGIQGITGIGTQGVQGPAGTAEGGLVGLFAQTEDSIEVNNSNSPNYLIGNGVGTLSVPANGFQLGDSFKGTMTGVLSCANNQTLRLAIMANAFEIATTPSLVLPQITNKHFSLDLDFTIRQIGAPGIAELMTAGKFIYNKDSNNAFEGVTFSYKENVNFDTTILNLLQIKAEWQSTDGSNRIQSQMFNLFKTF